MATTALSDHFGLSTLPFAAGAPATPLASIDRVVADAVGAVAEGERLIVLVGRAGGGKTSALKFLAERLRDHGGTVRTLQRDVRLPVGRRIDADILLIDEAPAWNDDRLKTVLATARGWNLPVCLAVTEGSGLVALPGAHILPLPPIGVADVEAYLREKVVAAGGAPELFGDEVSEYIAAGADGSLFRLRQLAGAALIEAMFADRDRVTREDVDAAMLTIPGTAESEREPIRIVPQPGPEDAAPAEAGVAAPAPTPAFSENAPSEVVSADAADAGVAPDHRTRTAILAAGLFLLSLIALWVFAAPPSEGPREPQLAAAAPVNDRNRPAEPSVTGKGSDALVDLPTLDMAAGEGPVAMVPDADVPADGDISLRDAQERREADDVREARTSLTASSTPARRSAARAAVPDRSPGSVADMSSGNDAPAQPVVTVRPAAVLVEYQRGNGASKRRAQSLVRSLESAGWTVAGTRAVKAPLTRAAVISDAGPQDGQARQLASWVSATLVGDLAAQGTIVQPPATSDPLPPHVMAIRIP
jgi:energy-coupling factor transporter ATP-binding protein EcfA2|tara:strand:+ start:71444 stop:73039 length:1596 start_codon:yes stop_codon:yes gene_type:complete